MVAHLKPPLSCVGPGCSPLQEAVKLDPRNPLARYEKASVLAASGTDVGIACAVRELEALTAIAPSEASVYFQVRLPVCTPGEAFPPRAHAQPSRERWCTACLHAINSGVRVCLGHSPAVTPSTVVCVRVRASPAVTPSTVACVCVWATALLSRHQQWRAYVSGPQPCCHSLAVRGDSLWERGRGGPGCGPGQEPRRSL